MKKALVGMAIGAMALGASVVPVSAGYPEYSIWYMIEEDYVGCNESGFDDNIDGLFRDLVVIGGWSERLDTTGNGKPFYTVFAPDDAVVDAVLDALGTSIGEVASSPAVVAAILADHIANGSFDEDDLENLAITTIEMRSGFKAPLTGELYDAASGYRTGTIYIAGQEISYGYQGGNGWLYGLCGFIDSTPQVPTEGLNALDTPKDGTPGGTNSLPNTL